MKKILFGFMFLSMMMVLVACGDSDNGAKNTGVSSPDPSENGGEIEELSLRLGLVVGDWSPHYKGAEAFATALEEESGGKIKVEIFPDGQLGGEREMLEAVQSGSLDVGLISTVTYATFVPEISVIEIPYLVSTFEEAEKLMDSEIGTKLNEKLLEIGIRNLGWGHNDYRIISNNKKAINTPEDLKGVKMRVPENEILAQWFSDQGAQPTVMPFPDIYTGLQQGVIDGQDNGPILTFAAKFFEQQKHLTLSNHQYSAIGILINEETFSGYNDATKKVIENAGKIAAETERQAIRDFHNTAVSKMGEAGIEVVELTDEQRTAFKNSTKKVYEEIRKVAGDELVDLAVEITDFSQ